MTIKYLLYSFPCILYIYLMAKILPIGNLRLHFFEGFAMEIMLFASSSSVMTSWMWKGAKFVVLL